MRLKVLGTEWNACLVSASSLPRDASAQMLPDSYRIEVQGDTPVEKQQADFFHELCEVACVVGNITPLEQSHDLLDTFSNVLYAILRDNDLLRAVKL